MGRRRGEFEEDILGEKWREILERFKKNKTVEKICGGDEILKGGGG